MGSNAPHSSDQTDTDRTIPPTLLCVVTFPANVGFAWTFIEGLYAKLADQLVKHGYRTLVAYPRIDAFPKSLEGSAAIPVVLDASLETAAQRRSVAAFIRKENVQVLYLTDRPAWHPAYRQLRRAGVRSIVVHDHTSGERTIPRGLRKLVKWVLVRRPGMMADMTICVSEYVRKRAREVTLLPESRVVKVWNGVPVPRDIETSDQPLHDQLHIAPDRPLIVCACRATQEKGVSDLFMAFEQLRSRWDASKPTPALVYIGNGPEFETLQRLRDTLIHKDDVFLPGYMMNAADLQRSATVCVVPSVWQDALPLAVLEVMARGRPVVGTAVGGIPEMILDNETGRLVPPQSPGALADAIDSLLKNPQEARRLGVAARERVKRYFNETEQLQVLLAIVLHGFTGR
jgi:glycosyltransferase involved in cell wall biosynthesis